jgi:phage shock protein PspC (stress-responsive transcriptional regulator)
MIAGVAAGVARSLNMPVWLIRIAFIVLTIGGGGGLVAYVALWLLVRSEDEPEPLIHRLGQRVAGSGWLGLALVVVALIVLANSIPFIDGGLIVAAALFIIGVLIYRGDLKPSTVKPPAEPGQVPATQTPAPRAAAAVPFVAPNPKPKRPPSILGRITLGLTLVAAGGVALADQISPLIDAAPRHYLAVAVLTVGLGLMVGTIWGRARWLIVVGLLLLPALFGSHAAEFGFVEGPEGFTGGLVYGAAFGKIELEVTEESELEPEYRVGFGTITLDLSRLSLTEPRRSEVSVGAGDITVIVPENLNIALDAASGLGSVELFGERHLGRVEHSSDREGPLLELVLRTGAGEIVIRTAEEG